MRGKNCGKPTALQHIVQREDGVYEVRLNRDNKVIGADTDVKAALAKADAYYDELAQRVGL